MTVGSAWPLLSARSVCLPLARSLSMMLRRKLEPAGFAGLASALAFFGSLLMSCCVLGDAWKVIGHFTVGMGQEDAEGELIGKAVIAGLEAWRGRLRSGRCNDTAQIAHNKNLR